MKGLNNMLEINMEKSKLVSLVCLIALCDFTIGVVVGFGLL